MAKSLDPVDGVTSGVTFRRAVKRSPAALRGALMGSSRCKQFLDSFSVGQGLDRSDEYSLPPYLNAHYPLPTPNPMQLITARRATPQTRLAALASARTWIPGVASRERVREKQLTRLARKSVEGNGANDDDAFDQRLEI